MEPSILIGAFFVGLLGSTHCISMCGGIAGALNNFTVLSTQRQIYIPLLYNSGRLLSYTFIGVCAGGLSALLSSIIDIPAWEKILRSLTGLLLIGIGLRISFHWNILKWLESFGMLIWAKIAPLAQKVLPVKSLSNALLLGFLWGWLPCGMVYSILATAVTSGSAISGGLIMFSFGLGTLPAMISLGLFAMHLQKWLQNKKLRVISGGLIMVMGLWTITAVWINLNNTHHHPL